MPDTSNNPPDPTYKQPATPVDYYSALVQDTFHDATLWIQAGPDFRRGGHPSNRLH
jgi:hypothetical protein